MKTIDEQELMFIVQLFIERFHLICNLPDEIIRYGLKKIAEEIGYTVM